eukprot:363670-Chlamydomonas_euryale.AAC.26
MARIAQKLPPPPPDLHCNTTPNTDFGAGRLLLRNDHDAVVAATVMFYSPSAATEPCLIHSAGTGSICKSCKTNVHIKKHCGLQLSVGAFPCNPGADGVHGAVAVTHSIGQCVARSHDVCRFRSLHLADLETSCAREELAPAQLSDLKANDRCVAGKSPQCKQIDCLDASKAPPLEPALLWHAWVRWTRRHC